MPGSSDLARGEQPRQFGLPVHIGDHTATAVVRARHNRNGLANRVDTGRAAGGSDGRKAAAEILDTAGVEVHACVPGRAQPGVDSGGHHIAWRQVAHRVRARGH
jgi:hypothetical protein